MEAYGGLAQDSFSNSTARHTHGVVEYRVNDSIELKYLVGHSTIDGQFNNDVDATALPVGSQGSTSSTEFTSHEIQALGDIGDSIHFVFGVYYFEQDGETDSFQRLALPTVGPLGAIPGPVLFSQLGDSTTSTTSLAGYGNVTFDVTDRLSLTGGLRLGEERSTIHNVTTTAPAFGPPTIFDGSAESEQVLPLVRAQYQWSTDVMSYLSASKGFRGGGFNTVLTSGLPSVIPYDPETVWSYEFGTRAELFDRHLRFNPTVFYTTYEGIQIARVPPGSTSAIIENAGEAHVYGLELETLAQLTPRFSVTTALSYLKGQYDELGPLVTAITLSTPFARSPEWFYSIGAQYRTPLASGAEINMNLDYSYRTEQWSSATETDRLLMPDYALLNASVEYASVGGGWTYSVFGNNLTDEEYFVGGLDLRPVTGNVRYDVGRPRELGAGVRVNF